MAYTSEIDDFEVVSIAEVHEDRLVLNEPVAADYPSEGRVYPLLECDTQLSSSGQLLSDHVISGSIEGLEVVGPSMLPAMAEPGTNPAGYQVYQGLPVFDAPVNYAGSISWSHDRLGGYSGAGIGQVLETQGDVGRDLYRLPLSFSNREKAFQLLRFFDSRGGRTYPFWFVSPAAFYQLDAVISNTVLRVKAKGAILDWQNRPHIAIVMRSGDVHLRNVIQVQRNGDVDIVTMDAPLPSVPSQFEIKRVTTACMARFDRDEITESWHTIEHMTTTVVIRELLKEKAVLAGIDSPVTESLIERYMAGNCTGDGGGWPPNPGNGEDCQPDKCWEKSLPSDPSPCSADISEFPISRGQISSRMTSAPCVDLDTDWGRDFIGIYLCPPGSASGSYHITCCNGRKLMMHLAASDSWTTPETCGEWPPSYKTTTCVYDISFTFVEDPA